MFPFINLGFLKIPMYGLCMLIGIAISFFVAYKLINDKEKIPDLIIVAVLSFSFGILGAKILYILLSHPVKDFFKIVKNMLFTKGNPELAGGFVFYGGLIFAPLGYLIGCKIAKCKIGTFLKEFAVVIPLGHAFGRIGCFCAGCCYGIHYDGVFSVEYHNPISSVPADTGIFPVQLLEAVLLFLLFFALFFLYKRDKMKAIFYPFGYSIIRFFTEFFRGDTERGFFLIFSTSQWLSILIFLICLSWIITKIYLKKRLKNNKNSAQ